MRKKKLLLPGYVSICPDGSLRQVTGGIIYDFRVGEFFRKQGWEIEYFHFQSLAYPIYITRFLVNISLILRTRKNVPDLVLVDEGGHQQTWLFNRWVQKQGCIVTVIVHHLSCRETKTRFWTWITKWAEKRVLKDANLIVANSYHTISEIEELGVKPRRPVILAKPGCKYRLSGRRKFPENAKNILLVGNVEPRKGIIEAIEALFLTDIDSIRLNIVGKTDYDPDYSKRVLSKIDESGLGSRIIFHGSISGENLEKLYSTADLFLLPSYWEGYGMVLAEAMAHRLPIISTKAGAIPEIIQDGLNGILVTPGNVSELSEAIENVCRSRDLRQKLSDAAGNTAKDFPSWKDTAERIYRKCEEILKEKSSEDCQDNA